MDRKRILAIVIIISGLLFIYVDYFYLRLLGVGNQIVLALAYMIASGLYIKKLINTEGYYGMYLVKTERGIRAIYRIAKRYKKIWIILSIWGLSLSFGLLSLILVRKIKDLKLSKYIVAFIGIIMIPIVFILFEAFGPYPLEFIKLFSVNTNLNLPNFPDLQLYISSLTLTGYILIAIDTITGFSGFILSLLFYNAYTILSSLFNLGISFITEQLLIVFASYAKISIIQASSIIAPSVSVVKNQIPGVSPIIPGLNLPLIAGIIALAIILYVHELSHGILSAGYKAKIKSVGVVMFGALPVGAFVEPEDKQLKELDDYKKTNVFVAGVSFNFLTALIALILFIPLLYYANSSIFESGFVIVSTVKGYPAYGVIPNGSVIERWNGINITNISTLNEAARLDSISNISVINTSNGNFTLHLNEYNKSNHLLGIRVELMYIVKPGLSHSILYFLYRLTGLIFLLSFLVATTNLLPIPGFDGWQIYKTNIKSRLIMNLIVAIMLIGIMLNIVPYLFK
ncbi:MAG: hypothetical protein ARM1_0377 [Candidatus Micrarchaeota archaeon]|nr:MAG: hypothetical protein ARM1_0377 [Candidatus Micrarchaeota archaeon]